LKEDMTQLATRNAAIRQASVSAASTIPRLSLVEVKQLADAARDSAKGIRQERDPLLIMTLFDGCLRSTEALRLTPTHLHQTATGWALQVLGKGNKYGQVAVSASLAAQLQAFCYRWGIGATDRIFPITKWRSWQIVNRAFQVTGIPKPEHVGAVHVLRHSGALYRLEQTGNPKAVQDQLRHETVKMTLRYMKTLSTEESLRINQGVEVQW
jgi:integrase